MLTRAGGVLVAVVAVAAAGATPAVADGPGGGVKCPPRLQDCDLSVHKPGGGSHHAPAKGGGGGGGHQKCAVDGKSVPCRRKGIGTFNPADSCYWQKLAHQPKYGSQDWKMATAVPSDADKAKKGALFNVTCTGKGQQLQGGTTWAAHAPGKGPSVEALAKQAVEKMALRGPDIGIVPKPGKRGIVGMPTWMWNKPGGSHTGPTSASASAGGVTVKATAHVKRVRWSMGDGRSVTCRGRGTPYKASYGKRKSPDCGHVYQQTSKGEPGGKYRVTATSSWTVDWHGAGQSGQLHPSRTSHVDITVGEAQVVN